MKSDPGEAAKLYRIAGGLGNLLAYCHLGLMYLNGEGIEKSQNEAGRWLIMAAEKGESLASCDLAIIYAPCESDDV